MFKGKKILAIIPARGGSKGVPGKNIKPAGGKPLIAWMIQAAKASRFIDRLVLSSDDEKIIKTAERFGCEIPFVRPSELARDESSSSDVILHALNKISGYDYVMLLQLTSPLTITEDIDGCIESCITSRSTAMVSVTEPDKSPYWMFEMEEGNTLVPVLGKREYLNKRRQDLPRVYMPNGAIYIAESGWFSHHKSFFTDTTAGYVMPRERSLDIDTELDFKLLESVLSAIKPLHS